MRNPNNLRQLRKAIRSFISKKSASLRSFSKDFGTVANDFNRSFTCVGQVTVDKINSLANECNFDLSAPAFDLRIFPLTGQFNFKHLDCDEVVKIDRPMPANYLSEIDNAMKGSLVFPRSWKLAEL